MSSLHPAVTAAHLADTPSASGVAPSRSAPPAAPAEPATPTRRPWSSLWTVRAPISRRAWWALALTGLVAPLLGWWALATWGGLDPTFMPSPGAVLGKFWFWLTENDLIDDMAISTYRVVAGFVLSAIGSWRAVQALLEPLTDFIRYMPAVAFIPLVMLWVGIDEGAKVAIIFIGTFFQMVLMVAEDVRRVPAAQVEAAQTMGASRAELIEKVILPSAKPALLDTLRITMGGLPAAFDGVTSATMLGHAKTELSRGIDLAHSLVTAGAPADDLSGARAGSLGETAQSGDINLAVDTFHSQFTDHLDTRSVDTLPDMQGAGQVRNLREAASISSELLTLLTQFASATRSTQQTLIDSILKAWSATSTMNTTFNGAYAGHELSVNIQNISGPAYQAWQDKLTILEHFNGRTFNPVPSGNGAVTVNLWTTTQDLLQQSYEALKGSVYQSYEALKGSVYQSLALQTRLKGYLDQISLNVTENGVALDFSGLEAAMDARHTADAGNALVDRVELVKYAANDSEWRMVG